MAYRFRSGKVIRCITAPYFLATKLAAFEGRGDGDYVLSHDLEDVIAVIDGRQEIEEDVRASDPVLRKELADQFQALLGDPDFLAAVPGHLPGDAASQARVELVMSRIERLTEAGVGL
ncbi:MAG: hypothetical protein AAGH65_10295, partial [Pseudomonadota bacterium]